MEGGNSFLLTQQEAQKVIAGEGKFQSKQYSFIPLALTPQSLHALALELIHAERKVAGLRGCGHIQVLVVTTVASDCV